MQKLIVEICDASHAALSEPVCAERARDLAMGAAENFIGANDGGIATACFSFLEGLQTPKAIAQ